MIEVKNISKYYKKRLLIDNCSFNINDNKFTFILGVNGIGKTSLFKCLLNLEKYKGEILYDKSELKNVIGKVFSIYDDSPLYLNLSGMQNIKILTNNIKNLDLIDDVLISNLDLTKKVKFYSYGQKKKLSIIIAIILQPKYLIIDELLNGIDYDTISWIKKNLKLIFKNTTIIGSGHQLNDYTHMVDEIFVFKDKQLVKVDLEIEGKDLEVIYAKFIKGDI